ncbi:MAG: hypothetical protein ACPG19_05675 [Saprospiraceae bacterium]
MSPVVRNVLAVLAGVAVGTIVNMGIIQLSGSIIPPPEGIDPSDMESIKANAHLLEAKHFIFPFLAHAMGTLIGAYTAVRFAANNHKNLALGIGGWFLLGGIAAVFLIGGPLWFTVLDLGLAYIPMGLLGWMLAKKE